MLVHQRVHCNGFLDPRNTRTETSPEPSPEPCWTVQSRGSTSWFCVLQWNKNPLFIINFPLKIATNWRWISYFKAQFSPHVILLLNKKYIPSYPRQIYPENGPCYTWKFGQTRKLQSVGWTILNAHYLLTRTPLMVKSPFFHRKIPISVD